METDMDTDMDTVHPAQPFEQLLRLLPPPSLAKLLFTEPELHNVPAEVTAQAVDVKKVVFPADGSPWPGTPVTRGADLAAAVAAYASMLNDSMGTLQAAVDAVGRQLASGVPADALPPADWTALDTTGPLFDFARQVGKFWGNPTDADGRDADLARAVDALRGDVHTAESAQTPLATVAADGAAVTRWYTSTGKVAVHDQIANVTPTGGSGTGFVQSRVFASDGTGSVAAGLTAYEYRISLDGVGGDSASVGIVSFAVAFPGLSRPAYGTTWPADLFVVTSGSVGQVAPTAAYRTGDLVNVVFDTPIRPGQGSYFIGMTSGYAARTDARFVVRDTTGAQFPLTVQAPRS